MRKTVAIIGAGFSGLSAGAYLSKSGYDVAIYEKNADAGGRARKFEAQGYTFDMGPTWYWLPDVFERFFENFGQDISTYYTLKRVDPSYRIFFGKDDFIDVPADIDAFYALFEQLEPGCSSNLRKFLLDASFKYKIGMGDLIYNPGLSISEFINWKLIRSISKVSFFKSISAHVRSLFKSQRIFRILEFPVIFLGATAKTTPALYSLMNHADIALGTWYPAGGMYEVIRGMVSLNKSLGTKIFYNSPVTKLNAGKSGITSLITGNSECHADAIVAAGDYHHVEQELVPPEYRSYKPVFWESRKMAPSSIIFYLGVNKKLTNLLHHNLFFDEDFDHHADEIYKTPRWPDKPAMYVSVNSKTDTASAPEGCESMMILIPVAVGLDDNEAIREHYYHYAIERLEYITGESLKDNIVYKRSYAHNDFIRDYNAYKGNAYGLANTLLQTAILKPKMNHKKIPNLFYCGQLTVPGPGVPPSIISGEIAANLVFNYLK